MISTPLGLHLGARTTYIRTPQAVQTQAPRPHHFCFKRLPCVTAPLRSARAVALAHHTPVKGLHAVSTASAVQAAQVLPQSSDMGYCKSLESCYAFELAEPLGRGGNATVHLVRDLRSGKQFACKSIAKTPAEGVSDLKRRQHLDSIRREVDVLQRLRHCLNVVELQGVYEDAAAVHLVTTLCSGGELFKSGRCYSERKAARYMRAVLRTVAQCHAHHILHRDVKPSNFLFQETNNHSSLQAIDFGLAMSFEPGQLPRTDLGLEGTPWFMAPEALAARVGMPSDVWAAGVTAYQLLAGRVPFDDRRNPQAPAVSAIWRAILTESPDLSGPRWSHVSPEGRRFVASLLHKDPSKRPTAREALQDPWLRPRRRDGQATAEHTLGGTIVRRLQRWGQAPRFKQAVLRSMASELLAAGEAAGCPIEWPAGEAAQTALAASPHSSTKLPESLEQSRGGHAGVCAVLSSSGVRAAEELQRLAGAVGETDVSSHALADALRSLGLRLSETEVQKLVGQLTSDTSTPVNRTLLLASQLDWEELQHPIDLSTSQSVEDAAHTPLFQVAPDTPEKSSGSNGSAGIDSARHLPAANVASVTQATLSGPISGAVPLAGTVTQALQQVDSSLWHTLARGAFAALDTDGDGVLQPADIARAIHHDGLSIGLVGRPVESTLDTVRSVSRDGRLDGSLSPDAAAASSAAAHSLAHAAAKMLNALPGALSTANLQEPAALVSHADMSSDLQDCRAALDSGLRQQSSPTSTGMLVPLPSLEEVPAGEVDYEGFVNLLRAASTDNLELYDSRSLATQSEDDDSTHSRRALLGSLLAKKLQGNIDTLSTQQAASSTVQTSDSVASTQNDCTFSKFSVATAAEANKPSEADCGHDVNVVTMQIADGTQAGRLVWRFETPATEVTQGKQEAATAVAAGAQKKMMKEASIITLEGSGGMYMHGLGPGGAKGGVGATIRGGHLYSNAAIAGSRAVLGR